MSSRQDDHMDDAEFEAEFAGFLRGEGELARMLAQVPQPKPSSELDSKILADAQAALAQPVSANDAVVPEAQRQPPEFRSTSRDISRFIRRARAPLGLAATVVIAVSLGVQWYQEPEVAKQMTVPAVPELKAVMPPSTQSADMPAPAADAATAAPLKQEAARPVPKPAETMQPARKKEAPVDKAEARLQEVPAPAPAATPEVSVAPMPPPAPIAAPAPAGAAADGAAESRKPMAIPPPPRAIAAVPSVTPVVPKAAAPQASFAYSRAPEPGTLSKQAVLPTADVQGIVPAEYPKAREWLQKIDDLIRQGRNDEALRSWEDFRKAYPDYAVPEPLKEKLKALAP